MDVLFLVFLPTFTIKKNSHSCSYVNGKPYMDPSWVMVGRGMVPVETSPNFPEFQTLNCWRPENPWGIPKEDLLFPAFWHMTLQQVWIFFVCSTSKKNSPESTCSRRWTLKTNPKPKQTPSFFGEGLIFRSFNHFDKAPIWFIKFSSKL